MPFVEIHDTERSPAQRQRAAEAVTAALVEGYGVPAASVDIYFLCHAAEDYARSGLLPAPAAERRTLVKVHAFARPLDRRQAAARLMTRALAESFGVTRASIAIYFLDRGPAEVAHAGVLASEENQA